MNRSYPYLILGFVAWSLGASPAPAVGDVRYTITELPMSQARAINDLGAVTGVGDLGVVRWQNGQLEIAPGIDTINSQDINNHSVVVGGEQRAYTWDSAAVNYLPTLNGLHSTARGINDAGRIVGWLGGVGTTQGCFWDGDQLSLLGALGGAQSWAFGINETGDIVGRAETAVGGPTSAGETQAFLHHEGVMQPIVGPGSTAYDINDLGQIVGQALPIQAFMWQDGDWDYLPFPSPDAYFSVAVAINNRGQIVGRATVSGYDEAVLWDDEGPHYLSDLIPSGSGWAKLERATDINESGQIVGWGYRSPVGPTTAFLLTPIPEPHSLALYLLGAGVTLRSRRPRHDSGRV